MNDITQCTTTTCPKRDACLRSVAWQAVVGTDCGPVWAINGQRCQQDNYDMYRADSPQPKHV